MCENANWKHARSELERRRRARLWRRAAARSPAPQPALAVSVCAARANSSAIAIYIFLCVKNGDVYIEESRRQQLDVNQMRCSICAKVCQMQLAHALLARPSGAAKNNLVLSCVRACECNSLFEGACERKRRVNLGASQLLV